MIFLDFDGVINRGYSEGDQPFDPDLVERVNRIIEETGADVVVSSCWRITRSVEELQEILDRHGFEGDVVDKLRSRRGSKDKRGDIIREYAEEPYVVIDDSTVQVPREVFIQTDREKGIQDYHVDRAIEVLA